MIHAQFDRDRLLLAIERNEVLIERDDELHFVDPDTIYDDDGALFADVHGELFEVLAYARDLNVIPPVPQITVAWVNPANVDECWKDPDIHVIIVDGTVMGALGANGQSRPTRHGVTVTRGDGIWMVTARTLSDAINIRR